MTDIWEAVPSVQFVTVKVRKITHEIDPLIEIDASGRYRNRRICEPGHRMAPRVDSSYALLEQNVHVLIGAGNK